MIYGLITVFERKFIERPKETVELEMKSMIFCKIYFYLKSQRLIDMKKCILLNTGWLLIIHLDTVHISRMQNGKSEPHTRIVLLRIHDFCNTIIN